MAAKPPKKPLRITAFCVHGLGRSQQSARRVERVLELPKRSDASTPHDRIYHLPSGETLHVSLRRLYRDPDRLMDEISPPALSRYDMKNSDILLSECANPRIVKAFRRDDLIEASTEAQNSGKLISDLPLSDDEFRKRLLHYKDQRK
jgi:hypothetical protein